MGDLVPLDALFAGRVSTRIATPLAQPRRPIAGPLALGAKVRHEGRRYTVLSSLHDWTLITPEQGKGTAWVATDALVRANPVRVVPIETVP